MKEVTSRLFEYKDAQYASFQSSLIPTLNKEKFIGVRVPDLRRLTKEIKNETYIPVFMKELPHTYYDENMLHALLINEIKEEDEAYRELNHFLPYVDNWAVCDILNPKIIAKDRKELVEHVRAWLKSNRTYTVRFGIGMLMRYYLDEDFNKEYLRWVSNIRNDEYYVKMMQAWYFATALAKKWDEAIIYIEERKLDEWTHQKTIQKGIESFRITKEEKEYLKTLK